MKVAVGCDHAGWHLKSTVLDHLKESGIEMIDMGTDSQISVDYPDFASKVAKAVQSGVADMGILICGTGLGMAITANKFKGIRAVAVTDCLSAKMARAHNNANILTFGSRIIGPGQAIHIIDIFLSTKFEGGRHEKRLEKIKTLENSQFE